MKFHFLQNDHNQITPAKSFIFGASHAFANLKLETELKIFHYAQNEISSKHPFNTDVEFICESFTKKIKEILSSRILSNRTPYVKKALFR